MPILRLTTHIAAPIDRCFDLSRSIDLHMASTAHTEERAIAGVTTGLIGPGGEVTWRARHFGVWQELTSRFLGRIADAWVLTAYLRRLLEQRNRMIKQAAESERWRDLLHRPC